MPRILVLAEPVADREPVILLREQVMPAHVQSGHSAEQLIERLGWAVADADELERTGADGS